MQSNDGEVGQSRALSGICVGSPFGSNDDDRRFFWFRSDLEPAEIRAEILNQNEQLPLLERFPLEDLPTQPGDADAPVRNFRYS